MAATIPDLWPDDIRVDVLAPLQILRVQEALLGKKLQGVLEASVSMTTTDKFVAYQFDLIAPFLRGRRERLFTTTHARGRIYPVTVEAECFVPKNLVANMTVLAEVDKLFQLPTSLREAATQEEFVNLVREILHTGYVRSLIQSLVAQSNEARTGGVSPDGTNAPIASESSETP
jgi:hypothetical protein